LALADTKETKALRAIDAAAKPADGKPGEITAASTATRQEVATAEVVKPPVKTSLFGSSTPAKAEETQVASAATAAAEQPVRTSLFGSPKVPAPQPAAPETSKAAAPADKDPAAGKAAEAAAAEAEKIKIPDAAWTNATYAGTTERKNGTLVRLFANNQTKPSSKRMVAIIDPRSQSQLHAGPNQPVQTASALPSADSFGRRTQNISSLPGVRPNAGIQIMQRDSLYDDDEGEARAPVILASAAGLARLAPNGLKVQREGVDVACLRPQLVQVLKAIEVKYGKSVIVTSGYRSPPHNREVHGAKASLHMSCEAADIQIPGVSKWELAGFARSMPGRGGVGTYCYTESVHVDVGPQRDWNWRCKS
jgi:uncharacterized protein YcbK (DUF882 family)